MTTSRRDVLRALAAAFAWSCAPSPRASSSSPVPQAPPKKLRILILGGTGFLGPKTIAAALARGHEVTIFNRGQREKIQPLEVHVEHLYGNRDPKLRADDKDPNSPLGLTQLEQGTWDVVIDNSGMFPRHVAASAQLLAPRVGRYIYISSISAYDEAAIPPRDGDETVKLAELADPTVETMGDKFENYGGLKALCEKAAAAAFVDRAAIVRPGYIVGPGDPTDRFTYWPVRIGEGGAVLAPGATDDPVQWIDVRDLAEWLVTLGEHGTVGAFNAICPTQHWGDVLDTCVRAAKNDDPGKSPTGGAHLEWVPAAWLDQHGKDDDSFPIWVAPTGKYAGFHRWNTKRAIAAGLTVRPAADTIDALRAWFPGEVERRVRVTHELQASGKIPPGGPDPAALRAGISRAREAELLAEWAKSKTP